MTLTNSIGLMALFMVDLVDLYFLNMLGEQEMAASVGFSAQLMFYVTALSIGFLIAIGVLVSRRIGAKQLDDAKLVISSVFVVAIVLVSVISGGLLWNLDDILHYLGAQGRTFDLAVTYSSILLPSSVILVIGMLSSAVMRAVGDARRAMHGTLIAAAVNLCLDPILIFVCDMGVAGAAWSSVISRVVMMVYAQYGVIVVHQMVAFPSLRRLRTDLKLIFTIAAPAILTNLATPIGSTFVMAEMARYGDAAVAAYATIGRIIPVAFSVLFALSGAISPIIGQNFGAQEYQRIKEVYRNAIIFAVGVVVTMTVVIVLSQNTIVSMFNLSGEAAQLLSLFCSGITVFFIAEGVLFSTNSAFNSLGFPLYSTFFNYARFFLGIIPTVYVLSHFYGAAGVLIGQMTGACLVSLCAVISCNRLIRNVSKGGDVPPKSRGRFFSFPPLWPSSSSKTQV